MSEFSFQLQSLWAKKSRGRDLRWLPLPLHLIDTAGVARRLWNLWVPEGVKETISAGMGCDEEEAGQCLVFLAAAHDLGKATPAFQAKLAEPPNRDLDERLKERQAFAGLPVGTDFQNANAVPHALASMVLLLRYGCPMHLAAVVGGHHGKPPSPPGPQQCSYEEWDIAYANEFYQKKEGGQPVWQAVQRETFAFALALAGYASAETLPRPNMEAQVLLSGLVIMADWIASNEIYFPLLGLDEPWPTEERRATAGWRALGLPQNWKVADAENGNAPNPKVFYGSRFAAAGQEFFPRPVQAAVLEIAYQTARPGIAVLEAPMGIGKTEAALAIAEVYAQKCGSGGVFFALPTQATSNGVFTRLEKWVRRVVPEDDRQTIQLVHGKAQFNEAYRSIFQGTLTEAEERDGAAFVHQWFCGRKQAMLADFTVGTVDQLLLASLRQKHLALRHLALSGKVVIVDECHAYDAYMNQYLCMALRWLGAYGVPVIVLSATLPAQTRRAVVTEYLGGKCRGTEEWMESRAYPLLTWSDGETIQSRALYTEDDNARSVSVIPTEDDNLWDVLAQALHGGGCAGVIVNTVARAQAIYRQLRQQYSESDVTLLHSRFIAPDRAKKEEELNLALGKPGQAKRPPLRIVVGTQVLEQSLDIDFDVMITDLCPMDLLLQRLGRLHRHTRPRPEELAGATCYLTGLAGDAYENSIRLYGTYLLLRTKELLPATIALPGDIPALVQNCYDGTPNEAWEAHEKRIEQKKAKADAFRLGPPSRRPSKTLVGWLDTSADTNSDEKASAQVRDSGDSVEVALAQERAGRFYLLPGIAEGAALPRGEAPPPELAKILAQCTVRLPGALCHPGQVDKTIQALEEDNAARCAAWQQSPWLRGVPCLLLDETMQARLCGCRLRYDQEEGLCCEKEGAEGEG
ncbi:MAG: CRISPR-associated helicase Cas3' [Oscillospiraceae bacterium]|jgi:CRISPR-associated endonuclease/helicase Cas3|nr:CRISPR-associated helicase Cas3' [Oscillospiraceae bacterium]